MQVDGKLLKVVDRLTPIPESPDFIFNRGFSWSNVPYELVGLRDGNVAFVGSGFGSGTFITGLYLGILEESDEKDRELGRITIVKHQDPFTPFNAIGSGHGFSSTVGSFDLQGNDFSEDIVFNRLDFYLEPGEFELTEFPKGNFLLDRIRCETNDEDQPVVDLPTVTIALDADEEVKCTFFNTGPVGGVGFADLNVNVKGDGKVFSSIAGVACEPDCSETYTIGTQVRLSAEPAATSVFARWSGDEDCADGQVGMGADLDCAAVFQPSALNCDIDGNSQTDALTDGILVLRYLFMFGGDALVGGGVLAPDCTRCSADDIEPLLQRLALDIDGNGTADALTDGILILRFLFQFRGDGLTGGGVVASDCTRCTSDEIESFLDEHVG